MRNRTILRRSLTLAVALTAAFAVYGLMTPTPTQAQAADGVSSRCRVGYRNVGYSRYSGYHGGYHGNSHYDRVYHHEGYHYTPWQGVHSYGHYDLVPSYGNHHNSHGGHHRSGLHFSFGF